MTKFTATLVLAALLLPLSGCAWLNPKAAQEDKVAALEKAVASTSVTLTQLRADGKISDADWKRIKEIGAGIDATFDALHDDLDAGRKVDVDTVLRAIRAELDRLNTYKTEASGERGDASNPAGDPRPALDAGQGRVYARAA